MEYSWHGERPLSLACVHVCVYLQTAGSHPELPLNDFFQTLLYPTSIGFNFLIENSVKLFKKRLNSLWHRITSGWLLKQMRDNVTYTVSHRVWCLWTIEYVTVASVIIWHRILFLFDFPSPQRLEITEYQRTGIEWQEKTTLNCKFFPLVASSSPLTTPSPQGVCV